MEAISPLFHSCIYQNLIQSLLLRRQGRITLADTARSAMIAWGPSIFIGGEFTDAFGDAVISAVGNSDTPRFLNYPYDTWRSFLKHTYSDRLTDRYHHLYKAAAADCTACYVDDPCIVPVTRELIAQHMPATACLTDELYSYTDMEDFYRNGFGLALLIDGHISGYCLSEYSINNSHGVNIWVDEPYRMSGYDGKMVHAFLRHCQKQGQDAYWVCNADNIPSNKTAVSSGFTLKSTRHYFVLECG